LVDDYTPGDTSYTGSMNLNAETIKKADPSLWGRSGAVSVTIDSNIAQAIDKMKLLEQLLDMFNTGMPNELAQELGTELGYIMQRNIDAGGRPQWDKSWRERLVGGTTLKDTGQLYESLPFEPTFVEGNKILKIIASRLNKDGNPLAKTMVYGGYIYPKNEHQGPGFKYGLRFPKAEGGYKYMPVGMPVYLPPRNFATVPDDPIERGKLVDIIMNYIEREKLKIGFIQEGA
jgi:hypothetical protein